MKNLLFVVEPNHELLTELARRIESLRRSCWHCRYSARWTSSLGGKDRGWHTWEGRAHLIEPCRGVKRSVASNEDTQLSAAQLHADDWGPRTIARGPDSDNVGVRRHGSNQPSC